MVGHRAVLEVSSQTMALAILSFAFAGGLVSKSGWFGTGNPFITLTVLDRFL